MLEYTTTPQTLRGATTIGEWAAPRTRKTLPATAAAHDEAFRRGSQPAAAKQPALYIS
jgi:hypothetical protein